MSAAACIDHALPRVHAIHHTNVDAPLLGVDASLDERADWIADEVCEQLGDVLPEHPDGQWQHVLCTTSLSTLLSGDRAFCSRLFDRIERERGVRPLALLQQYQCTGWGFGMRFAGGQAQARRLAMTVVDVDVHDAIARGFSDAIGRVGFGITTIALELAATPVLPDCAGPFANRAFSDLAHAVRALHKRSGRQRTFMPFLPEGLAELAQRLIGQDILAPNRYERYGHCFGSDPWIGLIEWIGREAPEEETGATLGSFAYDGYYAAANVVVGPYTAVSLSRFGAADGIHCKSTEIARWPS